MSFKNDVFFIFLLISMLTSMEFVKERETNLESASKFGQFWSHLT